MDILLKAIPIAIPVILVILIFLMGYVKAPPDVAYIISGLRKHPKVLIGKAGIKIPFLERVDKLIVRQISIDIKSEGYIPTQDFIGVDVDAVAKVRVMTDPEGIQLAMKNFLNMTEDDFNRAIVDSLQGNMREIIGTITLKEICNDRKKFGDEVQSKAQTDMNALGIQIISCNIQRVTDENSLINSLGQDNMSKIQKDAAIAKAEAERDIAIAQAQAAKASNDAQVEADMHIAQKQNDLAIKQSELKVQEDTKRAEADAAYTIQQQEQQRSIETATVNAQIAKTEREAELKSKEVEVKKQSLDAEVRAAADADRYRKEQEAQAALYQRQKDAEAVRYEQEQAAEAAKKAAEAARFAKEQEAAGIAAVGQAEAEAIRAKALAEAEVYRQEGGGHEEVRRGRCDRDDHERLCRRSPRTWRSPSARWIRSPCTARATAPSSSATSSTAPPRSPRASAPGWGWTSRACWQVPWAESWRRAIPSRCR